MTDVATIVKIARAQEEGRDLIELPSALGGLLVDDETLAIATDMELVQEIFVNRGRGKRAFFIELMMVLNRAVVEDEDPIETVRDWLNGWLEG